MRIHSLIGAAALSCAVLVQAADAQSTIHVPTQAPTIQAAIDQAASGDTVLVAAGVYAVNALSTRGKVLHLVSEEGADQTVLDGNDKRVFVINQSEGIATVIEGFTITDGQAPTGGGTVGDGGGGLLIVGASPTFRDCVIDGCLADNGSSGGYRGGHGGGAYISSGSPRFERCTFSNNRAGSGGQGSKGNNGADGDFFSHHADNGGTGKEGGDGGHGGAVYVTGSASNPVFANCLFERNRAGTGGKGGTGGTGGDGYTFSLAAGDGGDGGKGGKGGDGGRGTVYVTSGASARFTSCTFHENLVAVRGLRGSGGSGGSGEPGGSVGSVGTYGSYSTYAGIYAASGPVEIYNTVMWDSYATAPGGSPIGLTEVAGVYTALNSAARTTIAGANCFTLPSSMLDDDLRPTAGGLLVDAGNETLLPNWTSGDLDGHLRVFDRPTVNGFSGLDIGARENTEAEWMPLGCGTNEPGSLVALDGVPTIGAGFTLGVDDPTGFISNGSIAILAVSALPTAGPCGTIVPGFGLDPSQSGAALVDQAALIDLRIKGGWTGPGNPVAFDLGLPNSPGLVGLSIFVQGAMFDATTFRLAAGEGLEGLIGQ